MRYLKSFETYSVEEIEGGKVFEEKCADCNCNCADCDCTDCDCTKCCGSKCESVEIGKTYKYNNPSGGSDNGKLLRVVRELSDDRVLVSDEDGKEMQTNIEYLSEKKKATMKAKKEEKSEVKGLSAKQKKLPPAMQAAILKKMGKSSPKKADDKDDKKEKRVGLTAGQKRLPEAMQKAILAKQKK